MSGVLLVSYILLVQLILISPSPSILVVSTVSLITYSSALVQLVSVSSISIGHILFAYD